VRPLGLKYAVRAAVCQARNLVAVPQAARNQAECVRQSQGPYCRQFWNALSMRRTCPSVNMFMQVSSE
jgi:hypothetical protein